MMHDKETGLPCHLNVKGGPAFVGKLLFFLPLIFQCLIDGIGDGI